MPMLGERLPRPLADQATLHRRLPIGAEFLADGSVHFRVWAPKRRRVEVVLAPKAVPGEPLHYHMEDAVCIELSPEPGGYFSAAVENAADGMLYAFRLDGKPQRGRMERLLPDPASRFQPMGPAGPSQIVDPRPFRWTDGDWKGVGIYGQVVYEMHIGTFTPDGTWEAAARELAELRRAGITIVEVMPVADFPGRFGWGYDGVCMFAPTRLYGGPHDFRRFVDAAHTAGLGVILDVVYNHFGNVDNYVREFADDWKTDRYQNEWADAINFDGENSRPVREFFIANARYWIEEFHLDGYRFDATQAVFDASPEHILAEATRAARHAAGNRTLFLAAENETQDVTSVRSTQQGGHGMDAAWNDDFHHTAMVALTGKNPAYYSDFRGTAQELTSAIKHGFLYQGQISQWQRKPRGSAALGLPATAFISFLQNHDQVANSGKGERVHQLTSPGRYRAMTALWLLAPQTPLFFQGQEFAATSPFLFFADYSGSLGEAVARGRAGFLSQFPNLAAAEGKSQLPNPTDLATFLRCKLDLNEREKHHAAYDLHKDLLKLRREDPVFKLQRADRLDTAVLSDNCLIVRYFADDGLDRLLLVNLGVDLRYSPVPQPLLAPPSGYAWSPLWSSDSTRYGGEGSSPVEMENGWFIPGESAVVLHPVALGVQSASP